MSEATRPPIWMISLERAVERRTFVESGFRDLGLPYEIVTGVDGSALSDDQQRAGSQVRALFHMGRRLTEGTLGNAMSHLAAYQRMVEEQVPAVVVMEDDALPTLDLLDVIDAVGSFPDDWDVVTFCTQFDWAGATPVDDRIIGGRYRLCTYQRVPFGAQCYLVRLRAARRLLDVGYPVCLPADELLFRPWPARLRVYGIEPRLAVDGDFRSELVARDREVGGAPSWSRILDPVIVAAGKLWWRIRSAWERTPSTGRVASGDR